MVNSEVLLFSGCMSFNMLQHNNARVRVMMPGCRHHVGPNCLRYSSSFCYQVPDAKLAFGVRIPWPGCGNSTQRLTSRVRTGRLKEEHLEGGPDKEPNAATRRPQKIVVAGNLCLFGQSLDLFGCYFPAVRSSELFRRRSPAPGNLDRNNDINTSTWTVRIGIAQWR